MFSRSAELDEALLLVRTIDDQKTATLIHTVNSLKQQYPKATGLQKFKISAINSAIVRRNLVVTVEVKNQDDWFGSDQINLKIVSTGVEIKTGIVEVPEKGRNTWKLGVWDLMPIGTGELINIQIFNDDVLKEQFDWDYNYPMFHKTDNPQSKEYEYWIDVKFEF